MKQKKLIPFFDSAYQGFASGDLLLDIQPVRYFVDQGFSLFVSQSYAKNMGLYGHRTGCLHVLTPDKETTSKVLSQLKVIIRGNYSSGAIHGARIADRVLNNEALFYEWQTELKSIAERVISMRQALHKKLIDLKTPGSWQHIIDQIGMFSYTGLTEAQCDAITNKHHIHMMRNGRMAMVGLTTKNVNYVAESIDDVVRNVK
jgi:aspartate aminotransferase, cytoplasmic